MSGKSSKSRGNYPVLMCTRALPARNRGACANYPAKCGECFKFSNWKEKHANPGPDTD